jgi:ankyrin repeat protein
VRSLLAHGVDVNARGRHELTALMWAAGQGHAETVEVLLKSGADASLRDDRGKTAADIAAEAAHGEVADRLRSALR